MGHSPEHGADDFFVEILDRLNFLINIAHVTGFIDGFDMDEDKIIFSRGLRRTHPCLYSWCQETGDARDKNAFEASVNTQPVDDVDCGNHSTANAKPLSQRVAPEPPLPQSQMEVAGR